MNHRQNFARLPKNPAFRPAFERLDAALEENAPGDNRETIRLLRLAVFFDVDALEKSGKVASLE